jgi:hypothetical protein
MCSALGDIPIAFKKYINILWQMGAVLNQLQHDSIDGQKQKTDG